MASVTDSTGAGRAAGSGIVLAGDRSGSWQAAQRHTRTVRILKVALPAAALVVGAGYFAVIADKTGWGATLAQLEVPKIVAENLAMENPHYEGFNADGGRYWVTAKKAMQDLKNLSLIKLETISGELIDANKERTRLSAVRGTFDNKQNIVELFDEINVDGDNGLVAKLTRATIKTKENVISSDQPVSVAMAAGTITAKQMTIRQKSKEYTFVSDVRTLLKPNEAAAESTAAPAASAFGNSKEPITIQSNRLDVNDVAKTAIFTGAVMAQQGAATLTSPELEVSYEGSAVPDGKDKDAAKAATPGTDQVAKNQPGKDLGGKVKRVVAKNPVVMTQADGQQATARSADFDAAAQKAVLEGDVVMSELPDRRATGDRAELDQSADTVLLTGPVVVTQGKNELKGRRLFFNRATAKMNLTGAGAGNGRISARFSQTGGGGPQSAKKDAPARGVAFGGNFKTDPNAPVDVTAERLDVDDKAKQAVFAGEVKAQQAGFLLESSELIANYTGAAGMGAEAGGGKSRGAEAAKLNRIYAKRNVEITSKDGQKATGDWADYDTKANTVTLGGNVVMTQGKNVVRGTKLVIDMTSGESVISTEAGSGGQPMISSSEGDGNGMIVRSGRPSAVFYPNEIKEKAAKPANREAIRDAAKDVAKDVDGWQSRSSPSQ